MGVGAIGLSVSDFDTLLPDEFGSILENWRRGKDDEFARHTAIIRLHAAISVQPHCRKTIRPQDLFLIPGIDDTPELSSGKISKEEARKRFEQLLKERQHHGQ